MNKIRITGDRRCSSCEYYANSPHILCLVNPTHMRGQVCPDYTKEILPSGDYRDHISLPAETVPIALP